MENDAQIIDGGCVERLVFPELIDGGAGGDTGFLFVNNFQDHIAMAGRMEKASGLKAELLGAEIIPVDEFRL